MGGSEGDLGFVVCSEGGRGEGVVPSVVIDPCGHRIHRRGVDGGFLSTPPLFPIPSSLNPMHTLLPDPFHPQLAYDITENIHLSDSGCTPSTRFRES